MLDPSSKRMEQLPDWRRGRARQTIIGLYLSSQNMDGLSLEIEDIGINMPFEDLSDKEDIDSDDEKDKSLDNMEGVKAVSI